jgi:predicted transcriptional regulator
MLEELILSYVIWTDEMIAGVNEGIEDFRTGKTVSHDDAMAMLTATLEKRRP